MAETEQSADDFVTAGLAAIGIETDEVERAVIGATHQLFWPAIQQLLAFDTTAVDPERDLDLSRAP